jgi:hypothetical protein
MNPDLNSSRVMRFMMSPRLLVMLDVQLSMTDGPIVFWTTPQYRGILPKKLS